MRGEQREYEFGRDEEAADLQLKVEDLAAELKATKELLQQRVTQVEELRHELQVAPAPSPSLGDLRPLPPSGATPSRPDLLTRLHRAGGRRAARLAAGGAASAEGGGAGGRQGGGGGAAHATRAR